MPVMPVMPVLPVGGRPPLTPDGDAYAMAPEPEPEPEPHLLQQPEAPAAAYDYITIPDEKYTMGDKELKIKYDKLDGLAECDLGLIGIRMLKNDAELTKIPIKAQEKVLTHRQAGNVIIARISKKYANKEAPKREWGQCTPNTLLSIIKNDKSLYEIIPEGVYPYKPYFDIDEPYIEGGSIVIKDYLPQYLNKLNTIFKDADIAVCGNVSTKKISFHIVIHNYLIMNADEKQQLVHIANFMGSDMSVYTKNSLMKLLNQAKPPPDNMRTQRAIIGDDPRKHIITAFFSPDARHMPNWQRNIERTICNSGNESPDVVELKLKLYGRTLSKPFDLAEMPKRVIKLDLLNFDIYTATAEQLIEITPLDDTKDHTYTSKYALFCYHHIGGEDGISAFLKWRLAYKRIKPEETEAGLIDRWRKWFRHIPTKKAENGDYIYKAMSIENLRWALLQNNPELHRDKFDRNFLNMWDDKLFNHCDRLTVDRLDYKHYDHNSRKYVIAHIGMCGGKTAQTAKYLLENSDKNFVWLVSKIALAQNTCERLRAEGLKVKNYKTRKETAKAHLNDSKNLLVCLNSLHLLDELIAKNKIVVIDEIETFLMAWFNNETLNNVNTDKARLWRNLLMVLRKAEKVIFLDAFISRHTISFIQLLEAEEIPLLIRRPSEATPRKVQFLSNYSKWLGDIVDDLEKGKKPFIFYPYKNAQEKPHRLPSMEDLQIYLIKQIKERTGRDIKGDYYHGDIAQAKVNTLYNVNDYWDTLDFVICNTKITVGVSFEGLNPFDRCYILALGWVEPRDIIQVSYRPRTLKDELIKICLLSTYNPNLNFKSDAEYLRNIMERARADFDKCLIYENLVINYLDEAYAPYEKKMLSFIKNAGYTIIDGDTIINPILIKNLTEFLEGREVKHLYHNIKLIKETPEETEYMQIEAIKKKLYNNEATEREQVEYKKWQFNNFFKKKDEIELGGGVEDEETGEYIADTMGELELEDYKADIWDNKYFKAMFQMRYILQIDFDRNYKIFNEFKNMFNGSYVPTAEQLTEIMRKKIKLNENLLDLIFGNKEKKIDGDHFRTIKRTSATIHIIKAIYNTTFGKKLISVSKVRHQPKIDARLNRIIDILPIILNLINTKINDTGDSDQTKPERFIEYSDDDESDEDI
jgi:hypothetical protein